MYALKKEKGSDVSSTYKYNQTYRYVVLYDWMKAK